LSIGSVSGRTIHADGTVIPLNVKPEELTLEKTGKSRIEQKVFTLPSVEVGSVLEYTFQLRDSLQFYWHSTPEWEVQKRYPVRKAHFLFTPSDLFNLVWWPKLPQGASVKTDAAGRYYLDLTDIPAVPDEQWMPPVESLLYRVWFYYRRPSDPLDVDDYWKSEAKLWSKDIDHFAEPTKTIRDAVAGLVAPSDSELVKAQKLYAAVQALDNTDYSRQKTESERRELKLKQETRAEDVWTQKSGDRNEIARLYLAMLRAAGLTAYAMQVVNRDRGTFDPSYMTTQQLDDDVVILNTGGKETVLDPGEKMCPFGTVSWRHSGAEGLRQSADGPGRAESPAQVFGLNAIKRSGELTVDAAGSVSGTLQIMMTGQDALLWRQRAIEADVPELKRRFDREELEKIVPEGVEAHVDHFLGLDEPDRVLMAVVQVKGTLGTATTKRLILPGFFFETRGGEPFVSEEKRLEPVDLEFAHQVTDQVTYDLPAGASVEGAPPDAKVSWEGHAVYIVKTKPAPGQITVARVLADAFTIAKPEEYQDLRGFYQKVAAADQGQLVLTVSAAAKGN
ncbi:MAG: transglutaminase domain-containing protein, partial [Terracidiphilus sp.]